MLCESDTMEGIQGTCAFWRSPIALFASFLTGFVEEFLALHQLISNLVCSAVLQLKEESNILLGIELDCQLPFTTRVLTVKCLTRCAQTSLND